MLCVVGHYFVATITFPAFHNETYVQPHDKIDCLSAGLYADWVISKLLASVALIIGGLACGYVLWGLRVDQLQRTTDQLVLEQDTLKTLAGEQARILDRLTAKPHASATETQTLRSEILQQETVLAGRTRDLETCHTELNSCKKAGKSTQSKDTSVNERIEKLEGQLEQCLFESAALKRGAAVPSPEPTRQRFGRSPIQTTVEMPAGGKTP